MKGFKSVERGIIYSTLPFAGCEPIETKNRSFENLVEAHKDFNGLRKFINEVIYLCGYCKGFGKKN